MKKVLAFAGSNSNRSINQELVKYTVGLVKNIEVTVINLQDFSVPMFDPDEKDVSGIPANIKKLLGLFNTHDGFVIASPEHNGSVPAFFKNIIDWLSVAQSKYFSDKPVLLLSTSPGPRGGVTNLDNLAIIMPYWGAKIVGKYSLPSYFENVSSEKGVTLVENSKKEKLQELIAGLEAELVKD